jgi:aconitate hydratase
VIGSSASPGLRDFEVVAHIVEGRRAPDGVSFDVNPRRGRRSRRLPAAGSLVRLVAAGARLHQSGCMGCIGVGQAPATDSISLHIVPRNFPGRSGTEEDGVSLCSPETAAASALSGRITDPRDLEMRYPHIEAPAGQVINRQMLVAPDPDPFVQLRKGRNIATLPDFEPLREEIEAPVLLNLGDDVSTDEIMPAGRALALRSNIPEVARFAFSQVDEHFYDRAMEIREQGGHLIVGGANYGQSSSREHGALVPADLGLRAVVAKAFARTHGQNLVNLGVAPCSSATHPTTTASRRATSCGSAACGRGWSAARTPSRCATSPATPPSKCATTSPTGRWASCWPAG